MRYGTAVLVATLATIGLAACEPAGEDAPGSAHEVFESAPADLPEPGAAPDGPETALAGTFEPGTGAAGEVGGTVRATALGGAAGAVASEGFSLYVRVEGLSPGPHAWHIHEGSCAGSGPIAVAFTPTAGADAVAGAEPIVPGGDGVAQQSVTVGGRVLSFAQLRAGDYSIRVHGGGGSGAGPLVACASL